jgi:pimeloyl-ACP methyl ester carboxylesterase
MLRRRPELFSAFVGTGQFVSWQKSQAYNYLRAVSQAERINNADALKALHDMGPPPYTERSKARLVLDWSERLADGDGDPVSPHLPQKPTNLTPEDFPAMQQGMLFTRAQLFGELSALDLPSLGLEFPVPIFFLQGTDDPSTPCELVERYFAAISAPHKEFVHFERCHHFVVYNRPDDFLRELVKRVRPLLGEGGLQ